MSHSSKMADILEHALRVTQQNDTLKRSVQETTELVMRIHRSAAAATMRRCTEANQSFQTLLQQLHEFDKSFTRLGVQQYDPATFMVDCAQKTPISQLQPASEETWSIEGVEKLKQVFLDLRKQTARTTITNPIQNFLSDAIGSLDKAATLLQSSQLDGGQWSTIPQSLVMLLNDVLGQPDSGSLLEESFEALKRMQFNADEISEQQQQAVVDGDMKLSETLYFRKITVQEAMVDVFNKAFGVLDAHTADCFAAPLKRVHEVHGKVTSEVSAIMAKNELLRSQVEADLKSLKDRRTRLVAEDQRLHQNFQSFVKQNEVELKENISKTESIFATIAELERKLDQLSRDRADCVNRRIRATEVEGQRKAEVDSFEKFYKAQTELLEGTLHNCEVSEEVSDIFDEFLCNGCNALENTLREVDRDVEQHRLQLHESRLSHFRDLYLTLGDLQYKKERNLEELEKKIAHVHVQQELAMETFNPKAKEYSDMKKNLAKVREEMSGQIDVLQQKGSLHIEAFKPSEVALIEAGKQFLHPVQELQRRNEQRQQKLLEYHSLMSQEEDTRPSPNDVEAELRQIEEERAKMTWKKPTSAASTVRPIMN